MKQTDKKESATNTAIGLADKSNLSPKIIITNSQGVSIEKVYKKTRRDRLTEEEAEKVKEMFKDKDGNIRQ